MGRRLSRLIYNDILGEGFESLSIWLNYRNGNITGFSGFDIPYGAGLAGVYAAGDFALSTVSYFVWWTGFHFHSSISPHRGV